MEQKVRSLQVPVTIKELGDWGTYKLWLLSSQTSMVHEGTSKNEDLLKFWLKMCPYVLHRTCAGVNKGPMGQP